VRLLAIVFTKDRYTYKRLRPPNMNESRAAVMVKKFRFGFVEGALLAEGESLLRVQASGVCVLLLCPVSRVTFPMGMAERR